MSFYSDIRAVADSLLAEFGMTVTVTRSGTAVGSGKGVVVDSKAKDETQSKSSVLAQTSQTTKTLLLSAAVKDIQIGDVVTANKVAFTVQSVEVLRPTTVVLLYRLEVI